MARPVSVKLGLIPLGLFLLLAGAAAVIVPSDYGTNPRPTPPDEGPHLGYIEYLVQHQRLPVFLSANDNYESHQPPLYYVTCLPAYLAARAVFPGETGGLSRAGIVTVRLWSVLLAAIAVWVAWLLGRRIFGKDSLLSLAPPLFLALWPGRTMIVSAVTNDALADSLCLLTFYLCVVILSDGLSRRRSALLGIAWALALMTKSTSLALAPIVLLAVVMRAVQDDPEDQPGALKRALGQLLWVALPVVVLAGWWFVRNQMIYGDPLAAKIFEELFTKDRATPEYFLKLGLSGGAYFLLVVTNTALSFWGVFGQANVYHPAGYYVAGFTIWLAALAGLVAQKVRERCEAGETPAPREGKGLHGQKTDRATQGLRSGGGGGSSAPAETGGDWRRQVWVLSWLLLVVVVAFFLRFNTTFYQAQARYLFAASGPIVLLLTLSLWDLHRPRYGLYAVGLALAIMLVMSLSSVFGFNALEAAHYPPPFFGS
ncbi:MAG: ArnT family glycosyltransferase [Armatimonadota bacterium]